MFMEILHHHALIPVLAGIAFIILLLMARFAKGSTRSAGFLFGGVLGLLIAIGFVPGFERIEYGVLNLNGGKLFLALSMALILPAPLKWGQASWLWLVAAWSSVPLLGWWLGLLHWQPAFGLSLLWFALNNLVTVVAEDFYFRRFAQDHLQGMGVVLEVLATGALFGLAHWARGPMYALLAGIAGCAYAATYRSSGNSVWAVSAVHWSLNLWLHALFSPR